MSTLTQTRGEKAGATKQQPGKPANYKARVAKAAKQQMVLETVDLGPLGAGGC